MQICGYQEPGQALIHVNFISTVRVGSKFIFGNRSGKNYVIRSPVCVQTSLTYLYPIFWGKSRNCDIFLWIVFSTSRFLLCPFSVIQKIHEKYFYATSKLLSFELLRLNVQQEETASFSYLGKKTIRQIRLNVSVALVTKCRFIFSCSLKGHSKPLGALFPFQMFFFFLLRGNRAPWDRH